MICDLAEEREAISVTSFHTIVSILNTFYNNTHLAIHHVSAVWYHRAFVCKFCVGLRQQVRYVRNYFDFFILKKKTIYYVAVIKQIKGN